MRSPERILVVDDRIDSLELLSTILMMEGYEVEKCLCGADAIEIAKSRPVDLILLDVCMPHIDGFEVCQILKKTEQTKNIPIIFISALKEVMNKTQAFERGGIDYITKPFQIEEVLARIKNQLSVYNLTVELIDKNKHLEQENNFYKSNQRKLLEINQKLDKLATIDSLTQIANRRYFDNFLIREWSRSQRGKWPLSLIICDIDYFKSYNDLLGHQAGDACLKQVAQKISQTLKRPGDLVARYGGEEFVILLSQTSGENALQVAETIRCQIKQLQLNHPSSLVSDYISLSLGVSCVVPDFKYTKNQLMATADKALYQAKQQGRDRSVLMSLELD